MRYGIISDVHSNLEALNAVLAELDLLGAQSLLCLGDIVGYGPNPNECCEVLRERGCLAISGNHDEAAVSNLGTESFNTIAREALRWTQAELNEENRAFLKCLPSERKFEKFSIVHGAPVNYFDYISDVRDAQRAFERVNSALTFVGHTHVAEVFYQDSEGRTYQQKLMHGGHIQILADLRYIVNSGSVGQPRDSNPQASFALFDDETDHAEIRRASYDIMSVQQRIRRAKLPAELGARLSIGY